jgi:monoamine oxidase
VPTTSATDVVVVGAGLAGLYAARLLSRAGLDVVVLEARDRVGGRVSSRRVDGVSVDLGAQWIGPGQRRMYALVRELGLATVRTHMHGDVVVATRERQWRTSSVAGPLTWPAAIDAMQFGWRLARLAKQISIAEPWIHPRAHALDSVSFASWLRTKTFSENAERYWRYLVESGTCASADSFSPLEVLHQVASIGGVRLLETAEHEFLVLGAQTLAERLAEDLGGCVRIGVPATGVGRAGRLVRVTTQGGAQFDGHRVLLTVPPQLVGAMAIDSSLLQRSGLLQDALVLGHAVKSIVLYDRAWWRERGLSGAAIGLAGPLSFVVDGSGPKGTPGVLVALTTGTRAADLGRLDEETRGTSVVAQVERLFGGARVRPTSFLSTDWMAEPWSRGGYASRRAVGSWTRHRAGPTRRDGPLHFAGTETATEWRSYMEGALQSAERACAEILGGLGLDA